MSGSDSRAAEYDMMRLHCGRWVRVETTAVREERKRRLMEVYVLEREAGSSCDEEVAEEEEEEEDVEERGEGRVEECECGGMDEREFWRDRFEYIRLFHSGLRVCRLCVNKERGQVLITEREGWGMKEIAGRMEDVLN